VSLVWGAHGMGGMAIAASRLKVIRQLVATPGDYTLELNKGFILFREIKSSGNWKSAFWNTIF
jgi:hypothetical protein